MDLIFESNPGGYTTTISHGTRSTLCKWDTGTNCIVFNVPAMCYLLGCDSDMLFLALKKHALTRTFIGYPDTNVDVFLCKLSNLYIDRYYLRDVLVVVSNRLSNTGVQRRKVLIGKFFSDCCEIKASPGKDCIMTPNTSLIQQLNRRTAGIFNVTVDSMSDVYRIDNLNDIDSEDLLYHRLSRLCKEIQIKVQVRDVRRLLPSNADELSDSELRYALEQLKAYYQRP